MRAGPYLHRDYTRVHVHMYTYVHVYVHVFVYVYIFDIDREYLYELIMTKQFICANICACTRICNCNMHMMLTDYN